MTKSSSDAFRLTKHEESRLLVTRVQGRRLLGEALGLLESGKFLTVDLAGAEAISPSFADEFFGGLLRTLGPEAFRKCVKILGTNQETRVLVLKVLSRARRASHGETAA